jgi:hypothetical protein
MNKANQYVQDRPWITTLLMLTLITIMGAFLRLRYLSVSNFPLNDGGMFYAMIRDLQQNGFHLPPVTTYNNASIPYAYPPLSFYAVGLLNQYLHFDLLQLFRIYPLVYNLISIPLVYLLVRELSKSNQMVSLIATAFYASLVSSFEWLIIGGGLTRSPAHTYFIAAMTLYLVFLRTGRKKYFAFSAVCAALMTCHHLEYTWFLCFSLAIFTYDRKLFLKRYLAYGLYWVSIAVLSAPYWLTVVLAHGFGPFINAFSANGIQLNNTLNQFLIFIFTEENKSTFINSLAILGIFYSLITRRDRRILVWLFITMVLGSRSFYRTVQFPAVILAAIGLEGIRAAFREIATRSAETAAGLKNLKPEKTADLLMALFLVFALLHPFLIRFYQSFSPDPVLSSITKPELQAMDWVKQNTDPANKFLIIDPASDWFVNQVGEWFPALTERSTVDTVQGSEWLPDKAYYRQYDRYLQLQKCFTTGMGCLQEWMKQSDTRMDYLFITHQDCSKSARDCLVLFNQTISADPTFQLVYANDQVNIYKKLK